MSNLKAENQKPAGEP